MVVANHVHILAHTEFVQVGHVDPHREASFKRRNAGGLPATDNSVHDAIHSATKLPAFTNRKLVNVAQNKSMGNVIGVHGFLSGKAVNVADIFREVAAGVGPGGGSSDVVEEFRERVRRKQRETLRDPVSVIEVQGIVSTIACRNQVLIHIAEFRIGTEQLASRNSGPIEATTAGGNVAGEGIGNLIVQCISQREVLWIQLIEVQAARGDVDAVIPYVRKFHDIAVGGRVLESVHPLLIIVGTAFV